MKKTYLFLIILILGLSGCKTQKREIVINGKINGNVPEKVEYSIPINGTSYAGFRESVTPDSLGNFQIIIPISEPSIVHILIIHQARGRLVAELGKEYDVEFDLKSKDKKFIVTGENQIGQNEFNSLPSRDVKVAYRKFLKNEVVTDIEQSIINNFENEKSQFSELLKSRKISKDFYELVQLDRKCYYTALTGTIASYKYVMDDRFDSDYFTSEVKNMWTRTFEETPVSLSYLSRSQWFFDLMENFVRYNWYTNESFNRDIFRDKDEKGVIHTYHLNESKKYLPINLHEFYQAGYLYLESIQNTYDKELIHLFEQFKIDFPQSEFTRFLTPVINPIIDYHIKLEEESNNKNIKFLENSKSIKTLKECSEYFKGKMIYIDVWATWCGPCHHEFQHQESVKELLNSNDIVSLYISIDKEEDEKQWKDMIKFYELEGYHIRANKELDSDLKKVFGQNGKLSIPWYILIDEKGNIIKKYASRPSQLKDLEKEINLK